MIYYWLQRRTFEAAEAEPPVMAALEALSADPSRAIGVLCEISQSIIGHDPRGTLLVTAFPARMVMLARVALQQGGPMEGYFSGPHFFERRDAERFAISMIGSYGGRRLAAASYFCRSSGTLMECSQRPCGDRSKSFNRCTAVATKSPLSSGPFSEWPDHQLRGIAFPHQMAASGWELPLKTSRELSEATLEKIAMASSRAAVADQKQVMDTLLMSS